MAVRKSAPVLERLLIVNPSGGTESKPSRLTRADHYPTRRRRLSRVSPLPVEEGGTRSRG